MKNLKVYKPKNDISGFSFDFFSVIIHLGIRKAKKGTSKFRIRFIENSRLVQGFKRSNLNTSWSCSLNISISRVRWERPIQRASVFALSEENFARNFYNQRWYRILCPLHRFTMQRFFLYRKLRSVLFSINQKSS